MTGLGRQDHLCWVYDDPGELHRRTLAYVEEGLRDGQRVGYVGGSGVGAMAIELDRLAGSFGSAAVFTADLDTMYQDQAPEPTEQVRRYRQATERALEDGFTGLRVAADATLLVAEAEARVRFLRYEHLVDRAMTAIPFSAMCAYDHGVLGDAVAELSCAHPVTNHGPAFGVYAARADVIGLRGEIDLDDDRLFGSALEHLGWPAAGVVDIDATHLDFIDHRGVLVLARALRERRLRARMHCSTGHAHRLVGVLGIEELQVELV